MKILVSEKLSPHKFKTPEGYLICTDAILSRTGKQTYMRKEVFGDSCEDGDNEIEIDRLPEEVFSEKAMASFENKPICIEHPNEDVNVENHSQYSVGYVRDIHKGEYEGQPVMLGTLVITDKNAIEDVESGKLTDLSCGYDCDIADEKHPQQRNIRGNHVALCEQGRAGIAHIVDSVKDANKLPAKVKRDLEKFLTAKSTFIRNRDYDISEFVREFERVSRLWAEFPLKITREKIVGWNKTGDGMMRKDYYFSINGYDDEFMVSIYAKPDTYETTELNAYFTDSVKDATFIVGWVDKYDQSNYDEIQASDEDEAKSIVKAKFKPYRIFEVRKVKDEMKDMDKSEAIRKIKAILNNSENTSEDSEGVIYLTRNAYREISEIAHSAGLNRKDMQNIDWVMFGPGGYYTIADSMKDERIVNATELKKGMKFKRYDGIYTIVDIVNHDKYIELITRFGNNTSTGAYNAEKDEKFHVIDSVKDARYEIVPVKGHFEVYKNGKLWATANSRYEAAEMIREDEAGDFMEDDLIESGSEEAFKKNVKTEIEAGKDPKQAVAIAYATKRANDANEEIVLFKEFGKLKGTSKENYESRVRNENKVYDLSKFTVEEAKKYLKVMLPNANITVVDSVKDTDEEFKLDVDLGFKRLIEKYSNKKDADTRYEELMKLKQKPSMSGIEVKKLYNDALVEPSKEEIDAFEHQLKLHRISIKSKGKTWSGRIHYQVEANKDFDLFVTNLNAIEKMMKLQKIPMTFNAGSNGEGYCTAGIDLDKQEVKDSIKTFTVKYKDQLYKVKAKSFADACLKLRKNL